MQLKFSCEGALKKSSKISNGSVWALFLRTHAVLVEQVETRLSDLGLPPLGWYDVLWGLERAPGQKLRMSELADAVVLTRSNLTRLVDRLEQAGLVKRERSEEDRRGAYAVLTETGQSVRRSMWPAYQAAIGELFEDHLSDEEADMMSALLQRILASARADGSENSAAASGKEPARSVGR